MGLYMMQKLLSVLCWLYFKQCLDGCLLTLGKSNLLVIFLTSVNSKIESHFSNFGQDKIFNKTSLTETGYLGDPFATQSVRLPLISYSLLCSTCVTYRTSCLSIGHQVVSIQLLPGEAEDFSRDGSHYKHMPLLIYQHTSHKFKFEKVTEIKPLVI